MEIKEAVKRIEGILDPYPCASPFSVETCKALEMAIDALKLSKIIRCKNCKWYGRADKRRFYRGMDCLKKRMDTIVPDKDFCSRAERRTDE